MNKLFASQSRIFTISAASAIMLLPLLPANGQVQSIADGDWQTPSTWDSGAVPGSGDSVWINTDVVSSNNEGSVGGLAVGVAGPANLTMNSGSSITSDGIMQLKNGGVVVNSGGTLSKGATSSFMYVSRAAEDNVTLTVDGGTVTSARPVFVGENNQSGTSAIWTLNSGSVDIQNQLIFGGAQDANSQIIVNGGTFSVDFIQLDQDTGDAEVPTSQTLSVAGGDLILTTSNAPGALSNFEPNSKVIFDSGTITWAGVLDSSGFDSFSSGAFNNLLTNDNLISNVFTDTELQNNLQFVSGTGAVLAIPEPSITSLGLGLLSLLVIGLRRRR